MKYIASLCIIITLMGTCTCGRKVMVPPKIDLKVHEVMGIIQFTSTSEGKLASYTTKKFMDMARQDQEMVRIIELGTEEEILDAIDASRLEPEAYKTIGERYDVRTIFIGELTISDVRPSISLGLLFGHMSFRADVDATLNVRMIETQTGASIWSTSASATEEVGEVSMFSGGFFIFDAEDPEKAYGKLINRLVKEVTEDFRVSWRRE